MYLGVESFMSDSLSSTLLVSKFGVSPEKFQRALILMLLACFLLPNWFGSGASNSTYGQEEAAPAAPPAAPAEAPLAPAEAKKPSQNMLVTTWHALGPKYAISFLVMSFLLVAILVMLILAVRKDSFVPADLIQGVDASLTDRNLQAAVELVRADESFVGQVVSAGLGKIQSGRAQALEAMQVVGEDEAMKLEHKVGYLALIGNVAPMVGLLGTVDGMVASFGVIANSPTTPKPSALAVGIQTALYTTLVGLVIAIPAIIACNLLRNRIQRLIAEAGSESETMIEKFETALKQGAA
jgi:biopolymer transport protein ExbB